MESYDDAGVPQLQATLAQRFILLILLIRRDLNILRSHDSQGIRNLGPSMFFEYQPYYSPQKTEADVVPLLRASSLSFAGPSVSKLVWGRVLVSAFDIYTNNWKLAYV